MGHPPHPSQKMSRLVEFSASDDPDETQKSSLVDFFEEQGDREGGQG